MVLSDKTGANRVYDSKGIGLASCDDDHAVFDAQGSEWRVGEAQPISKVAKAYSFALPSSVLVWLVVCVPSNAID